MSDIYCPRCGEPWDADCLHDEAEHRYAIPFYLSDEDRRAYRRNPDWDSDAYNVVWRGVHADFQRVGCGTALGGAYTTGDPCVKRETRNGAVSSALYELLGDDIDGIAAMSEDLAGLQ